MSQTYTPESGMPIGVFDSGLGGLTAVRELRAILPGEDIVFFGDTARLPYGSRGRDAIVRYARQDIAFLLSKKVKTLLAACGTISSTFPPEEGDRLPVGYMGVVRATAEAAAKATRSGRIGIIATEATIASQSYQRALEELLPGVYTVGRACPLFVPLVENGHFAKGDAMATLAAEEYLPGVKMAEVDTLILGCTHYPLLTEVIAGYMGPDVTLIDSGKCAALALRERLAGQGLLRQDAKKGSFTAYVSDDVARFGEMTRIFLGQDTAGTAQLVDIHGYSL